MQTEQKKIGLALFFLTLIAGTITLLVFFVAEDNSSSAPTNTEEVSLEVYSKELRDRSGPWEECLGVSGEECVVMIEEDSPDLAGSIFIVEPDMMVTMDVRYDRVRIYVDDEGMVQQVPQRG
mmetsp:Transcript_21620/g.33069  ORF Transcript_21620/g.33069 Transcript_21620/m.33069 type:complete len:122 (+) Transcript_21620:109-474(+)|eukprot:CAMPEP_0196808526 /NCGR_PEP_ID=MMETSP1362-20130617/8521_1 /TAXON_ID=163516 /ORGANISM="Leptocylindrus danicus, Strain CCMP1856" /LENGTH=121 /DNA_ID=CAMNT_0042182903 /DNA_START=88 /DNA_END=453 /DNA_ORIENTATION=+